MYYEVLDKNGFISVFFGGFGIYQERFSGAGQKYPIHKQLDNTSEHKPRT